MLSVQPPQEKPIRVFLYGSLKKGQYNFSRFGMGRASFLGTTAIPRMRLFHNDAYPAAIPDEGSPYSLMGEMYDVPGPLFKTLEGVERGAGYVEISIDSPLGPALMFVMAHPPKWWKEVRPMGGNTALLNWDPREDS